MKASNYLNKYVITKFKKLLKVDNKEVILFKNGNYQKFSLFDGFNNCFSINFAKMIIDAKKYIKKSYPINMEISKSNNWCFNLSKDKLLNDIVNIFNEMIVDTNNAKAEFFEINDLSYNYISIIILREISKESYANIFYSELRTLSFFLISYNITPITLIKLQTTPDFVIQENDEDNTLIEIFYCKSKIEWKKDYRHLDWSISNDKEDLDKLTITCNINDSINHNLTKIEDNLRNLPSEKIRSIISSQINNEPIWDLEPFANHMKKISNYRKNNPNSNNLIFLIQMSSSHYDAMLSFSKLILKKITEQKYHYFNFKITITLIDQDIIHSFCLI